MVDASLVNVKIHDNHYATCLCCKHLSMEEDGPYSELTPGAGFSIRCGKGHFALYASSMDENDLHQLQNLAQRCNDFSPR